MQDLTLLGALRMADDIAFFFAKMLVGHGRLPSSSELVVLPRIPEALSCSAVSLSVAL